MDGICAFLGGHSISIPEAAGARFDRTAHGTPVLQGAVAYLERPLPHSTQDRKGTKYSIFIG